MKTLWAPWRMAYVLEEKKKECIFCLASAAGRKEFVLHKEALSVVMMNKYPYINGHLLVAPKRHAASLEDLTREEMGDLLKTIRDSIGILKKAMRPDGFNVGLNLGAVAGAGVEEHLHFHVVPRWQGDTNAMTVFGEVRVIPEHLEATYGKLRPHFEALESAGEIA